MQPRYLSTELTASLLQLQPLVVPAVREATRRASILRLAKTVSTAFNKLLLLLLLATLLLLAAFDIEGMAGFGRFIHSFKWTPLPLGVGFAVIASLQYRHIRRREANRLQNAEGGLVLARPWEVKAYKMLPLRHFSRVWGWVNDVYLPSFFRATILGSYVRTFGCDMTEAAEEDISQYSSLSSLFRRALKPGVRPVCPTALITSPADGTVMEAAAVSCGTLHQIKGVTYSIQQFLGPNVWSKKSKGGMAPVTADCCYQKACLSDPVANDLYQVVVYLAPGDYHRFHSPAEWSVSFRRHFPGELLSVNPSLASWIQNLFVLNERVAYVGQWRHGFISMTAVGATNVGSVKVYFDEQLRTNNRTWSRYVYHDKHFSGKASEVCFEKGAAFGEFNLGSTIVLLFEAPKGSVLNVRPGQKLRVGEAIVSAKSFADCTSGEHEEVKQGKGVER
uniref:Phosphatidylserine decarboxylase proenzyme, mitochondrial n=2 Tax=Hirondellea gigas TaxID=1518452 RepID=A0A2P2I362_9CRUS